MTIPTARSSGSEYVQPRQFVIVEGLLGFSTPTLRQFFDAKIYLDPPEALRRVWKIKRDTAKRGYIAAQVLAELEKREADSCDFIRPQREHADIAVRFYPPAGVALEEAGPNLNVRLVLRPTIPHPDLTYLCKNDSSGIRLELGRDGSRPVDFLEIEGGVATEHVAELEDAIWQHLPDLRPVSEDQFGAEFRFNEPVETLEVLEPGRLRLTTPTGVYHSKTVIVAAGLGGFSPNKISAPGAAEFENQGIHYVVRQKEDFVGKRLLIVGGGDTALDWALELQQWAREVTLIHRFDYFEAHERSVQALRRSKTHVLPLHELRCIGGDGRVQEATVFNTVTEGEHTLRVDDVLVCIGFKADIGPVANWGLAMDKRAIKVNGKMETNLPGVYAAGDITLPTDSVKMNLIANGYGQATLAVNLANQFIYPKSRVFPGHSSQKKGMKYAPIPVGHET